MTPAGSDRVDDLPLADLRRVVAALAARVGTLQEAVDRLTVRNAALEAENVALKDEIARLEGLPPRPKFKVKPSGMEQATSKPAGKSGRKRGHQPAASRIMARGDRRPDLR